MGVVKERSKFGIKSKAHKDRVRIKLFIVTGDSCVKCGEFKGDIKMLELHHIDPSLKSFQLSCANFKSKKWTIVSEEAKKCLPLCPNCHRLYHLERWNYNSLDLSILKDYQVELIKNYEQCRRIG